ncbi:glutathione S-transferase [Xylariaceae sp. FL0016]|nr:glutathione S-transferase [Xylariaceae sp. FL0016]
MTSSVNMSSDLKPIKLYGHWGLNPIKVALAFEELGLPYEISKVEMADVKGPDFVAVNPNGRLPAIYDPNTDITLWESAAILEYIVERYDTSHKLSFEHGSADSYHARQWLYFQASGQGPYYGQGFWFKNFASEKIPLAIERYVKELNRVSAVLEGHLARQKESAGGEGPWLIGNKFSFVDIAWFPWQYMCEPAYTKEEYDLDTYPHVKDWLDNIVARKTAPKTIVEKFSPRRS